VKTQSLAYHLTTAILRVTLLVVIIGAGWNIYHHLPGGEIETTENAAGETALQIILRPPPQDEGAAMNITVELYPVDVTAVQREFDSEHRPGVRFESFLKQRMQGRAPIKTQLDANGQATVMVVPGNWWLYATLTASDNVEWELPINVTGNQQTVELNAANIYARTKSF
jgi:hypothetical protein